MNIHDLLMGSVGRVTDGGCADCHAVQELCREGPGVYVLLVEHDATCPTLRQFTTHRQPAACKVCGRAVAPGRTASGKKLCSHCDHGDGADG